jgi:ubiquinone/menaquinone biosynthesis C-methylase UbiE
MKTFLDDFEKGKIEKRYVAAELPELPFSGREFDLALCSHFLFFYSQNLSFDFHIDAVRELCRVAREVRIFPLVDFNGTLSPYLSRVMDLMVKDGLSVAVERVDYEFQKRSNRMLVIKNNIGD